MIPLVSEIHTLQMKAISKLWQRFGEPIDNLLSRVGLLLVAKATHIVLLLIALAVVVMVSESVARYLQELLGLNEKYDVLKTIGFCVAGVLLVWQAGAANKRAKAMEDTAREQAKATANTEEGQRQERLKNAIEHLGHKRESVRMGGAYELFHLAKDTEDEDLCQTVMDILCAHIRQMTRGNAYQAEHKTKPSEEIQSLLTLLFIEEHDVFEDCSINLQGSYLNGATLSQARLKKANLRQAQLQNAGLREAQLQEAKLWGAQLQGANLSATQMQGTDLMAARMQGANLLAAQMQGAVLREAQLQGADLSAARMQGANLLATQMQGAILRATLMEGSFLSETQLQGADLGLAQLQGADLSAARLQGVSSPNAYYPLPPTGFESRITNRIGMYSDLTGISFVGGLQQEDLDTLCKDLSDDQAQALRKRLRSHVGKPANNELPENSGAVIAPPSPPYTQEEAERWIAEYNKAMREVPKRDDS